MAATKTNLKIIPIFVIYKGCPNRCVYCNERITAGDYPEIITEELFRKTVDDHLKSFRKKPDSVQIAFYGGNFTGIDKKYQTDLLSYAKSYVDAGSVDYIRISTRPDYIDEAGLELLKRYHVSTVEIGAQSMVDEVLALSGRGHSSDDVRSALRILKEKGFEAGVHLMVGLPGDTDERFAYTIEEIVKLHPDTARIHPTIVFKDTALALSYENGEYEPIGMSDAIRLCRYALKRLEEANISVIRIGLQMTGEMEEKGRIVAGPHHPAFRSLVEGSIFFDMALYLLESAGYPREEVVFFVSPKDVSDFRGLGNRNMLNLKKRFESIEISVKEDPDMERKSLSLTVGKKTYKTDAKKLNSITPPERKPLCSDLDL